MDTSWAELLTKAVEEPGIVSEAYHAFHGYSAGNQLLALLQCHARDIQPGPIATYPGWVGKGRHVKKGEKAITLCMPVTGKKHDVEKDEDKVFTWFVYKPHWFVLSQTDGDDYIAPALPDWNKDHALATLDITEKPFDMLDGNVMGYAQGRSIAISPLAFNPFKTLFHEAAHVLLHTGASADNPTTARNIQEVEAEGVAFIVCAALGLGELAECRGYIQAWLRSSTIPERSAQRILTTADKIIKAGHVAA